MNGVFFLFSFFPVPFLPHSDARELGLGFECAAFCSFPLSPFGFDFFLLSFLLTRSPEKGI